MKFKLIMRSTFAMVLLIAFSSCNKIKEATQRDVSITPNGIDFKIPVITSLDAGTTMGTVEVKDLNLDQLIKDQASKFGIENLRNVRITGIKIELSNSDDESNIQNLESVSAMIKAAGQTETIVAAVTNNPDTKTTSLTIPVTAGSTELKGYLTSTAFSYVLKGKARRATKKELNAKATFTYTLTVGL